MAEHYLELADIGPSDSLKPNKPRQTSRNKSALRCPVRNYKTPNKHVHTLLPAHRKGRSSKERNGLI